MREHDVDRTRSTVSSNRSMLLLVTSNMPWCPIALVADATWSLDDAHVTAMSPSSLSRAISLRVVVIRSIFVSSLVSGIPFRFSDTVTPVGPAIIVLNVSQCNSETLIALLDRDLVHILLQALMKMLKTYQCKPVA